MKSMPLSGSTDADRTGPRTGHRKPARLLAGAVMAVVAAASLSACTTQGSGAGAIDGGLLGGMPVMFSWQSRDGGNSGTMTATLPDATYTGPFFQITTQTDYRILDPLWRGWGQGWSDWPYWGNSPMVTDSFVTHYSGRVLANLTNEDGVPLRCRFLLLRPSAGMSGGGQGECQMRSGREIDASFGDG